MRLLQASLALMLLAACGGEIDASPRRSDGVPLLAVLAAPEGAGTRELRAGRVSEARLLLESALTDDPDRVAALNDLAVSYYLEERVGAARQLYEEVLARGGPREQIAALVNLAELYALDDFTAAATAHIDAARAIDPARPEPSYALAMLADASGDDARAQAALREALQKDEGGAARHELAFAYPEERLHLEALVAEAVGDAAGAEGRWRALAEGRFPALADAARRHLAEAP
jgi:Flp pilus assembly protein TadD